MVAMYRNGESYRFSQGVGKQYSYGKGREELSCEERLRQENKYLKQEIDVLKNAYCRYASESN